MKILYCNRTLYPFEGGADISALALLENLTKEHDVIAVYIGSKLENNKIKSYTQNIKQRRGVWINSYFLNKKFKKILVKIVEKEKPDLIISQDYLIPTSVNVAKKFGIKCVIFLRNYFHLSIDGFRTYLPEHRKFSQTSDLFYKCQYIFYFYMVKEFQKALKNADLVCSVSNYMRDITLKFCGVSSEVIRPFVFISKYKVKSTGEYITYINPDKHKGLDIFEKIANRLPDKTFLVVGKENYKINKPNIKISGWINDMKEIYEKTRLVIIPSIWPDPCPRVGIEAIQSGIPIIVSKRGGLTEEANNSGLIISNIYDIDEWVNAIKRFDNKIYYKLVSKNAKLSSYEFEAKKQLEKFNLLLNKLFSK